MRGGDGESSSAPLTVWYSAGPAPAHSGQARRECVLEPKDLVHLARRTVRTSQATVKGNDNNALDVRHIGYSLRVSNRWATMWAQAKDKHGVSYAWPLFFVP